jgi:tetratricopeptide (TPR) repeat protein
MTATQRLATPIALICGDPGVGKSSLAIHVGHQLRDHYPDGQLYVDLRPPGSPYLSPGQALVQLLSRLGVSPETIPVDLPARASLLRSHLAERAVLLVLDNAISEEQVSPLLPGGTKCGVLLTSRRPLGGLSLVASELLQRLSGPESSELLGRLIGAERVEREPDQAKRVVELCEGLPLALRICGARLAGRPGLDIRWLADRLADERRRLDMLAIGDLAIRSNLDLSFQLLDADEQSALRLLALPQVPDFAPWFAAAVLGTTVADAEDRLERLVESRLLACDPSAGGQDGRYRFHHLIRIYAGERAAAEEPADQREVSLTRAAALCLTMADELRQGLRRTVPKPSSDRRPGWRPADLDLAQWSDRPFAWFESERPVLIGVIRQLAAADHASLAWDLATSLDGFLDQRGWLDDWYAGHTAALAAARRGGEVRGTAWVLRSLGELMLRSDRYDEAVADLREAAEIFRRLGDHVDEAHALRILSAASRNLGNYPEALRVARAAVAILRTDGPPSASAEAWQCLGLVHRDCGRPAAALRCFTRALTIFQQQQEPSGQSRAWSGRGTALGAMGDISGATHAQLQAVRFAQRAEHRLLEAYTLCRLGEHYVRIDRGADAIPQLQQGLELCRQMGDLFGEAMALCTLGEAHLLIGADDRSVELLRTALNLARELGAPLLLARTLVRAGDSAAATDDDDTARQYWREALELFQQLGVPGGDGAQERLSGEAPAPRRQAQPGGGGRAVPA